MDPLFNIIVLLLPLLAVVTVGYAVTCAVWPFGICRRCRGTGDLRAPLIRAYRLCPRCGGSGRRLRYGRRLTNHLSRFNRELANDRRRDDQSPERSRERHDRR